MATIPRRLPSAAICISRYDLDRALADEFVGAGGELHLGRRLSCIAGEGMVRATGRRLEREGDASGWWGLKIHARHVPMISDLEMHVSAGGYVGLCRLAGGVVNVCGLFRRVSASDGDGNASRVSRDDLRVFIGGAGDGVLVERLAAAEFDETSYCAVAGLSLRPHRAVSRQELCIGDAVTMIPPVTGNGMSMALESAELAVEPLVGWARGETDWWRARAAVSTRCDRAFSGRLAWARWLQPLLFSPVFRPALLCLGARSDRLWRLLFERTR
jgi:flavin-dependent dehydrogenase